VINIGSGKCGFHDVDRITATKKTANSPALSNFGFLTAIYAPKKKNGN